MDIVERLELLKGMIYCNWEHPDPKQRTIDLDKLACDAISVIEQLRKKTAQLEKDQFMKDVIGKANWTAICKENDILRERYQRQVQANADILNRYPQARFFIRGATGPESSTQLELPLEFPDAPQL